LVLSGELFNGPARSSSPARSASPDEDPGWHDDEYIAEQQKQYQEKGLDYDSDTARRDVIKARKDKEVQPGSIGMGPGRTGVKGVIRDRDEAVEIHRERRAKEAEELRKKMEASNLGGKTFLEEEREKIVQGEKADDLVRGKSRRRNKENEICLGKNGKDYLDTYERWGSKALLQLLKKKRRGSGWLCTSTIPLVTHYLYPVHLIHITSSH
jgi:hypothetical protein